jgi:hypothetical protein
MSRRDLPNRIGRLERERGLSAEQQAFMDRLNRFLTALNAYETERDRITAALPPGWRFVKDFLLKDGHVVSTHHRATDRPKEVEDGCSFDVASGQLIDVHVVNSGLGSCRPPCEDDVKWQAEYDQALPEHLRRAIVALVPLDWIDYFNGKEF